MPRDASLFETAKGRAVKEYFLLRKTGGNVPPMWIDRAEESRKTRQSELRKVLQNRDLDGYSNLEEWELAYQKECFYRGIRILMELERKGKTSL